MKTSKKIALACSLILSSVWLVRAARVVYNQTLVNETALAYNNTYSLDMGNSVLSESNIDALAMQAVYSSATISAVSFNDGAASTGTITVVSTNGITGANATNTLTVIATGGLLAVNATDYITISTTSGLSGSVLTVNGITATAGVDWNVGTSTSDTATRIKNFLSRAVPGITFTVSGNVIYATATVAGVNGNSFTITSSTPAAMTVASANFTGGRDNALNNAYFNLNGMTFLNGDLWTSQLTSSDTASNIASAINTYIPSSLSFYATFSNSVVTVTTIASNTVCNAFTLTSSTPTALAAGAATFSGGKNTSFITINGITLTQGINWNASAISSTTAKNISDAIQANGTLSALISSTWTFKLVSGSTQGVVTATSTYVGANKNYGWFSSTNAALAMSNEQLFGGTDTSISTTTGIISATSHGLTKALPVLYTKSAGTSPGLLVAGTTYYPIIVNANSFKLSSTSTGAVASLANVSLTTQTSTGGGTFALTPLGITGTPAFKWQLSNDNSNWSDVSVSSVTISSFASATTTWDFGTINYRYIRLNFVAPTAGGINIVVTGIGKNND